MNEKRSLNNVIANGIGQSTFLNAKAKGFLGACLLGNLLKMRYSDIEFCGTFDHMYLPTDRLSKFKISLLVVACSAYTLSLSTPTTIFFTLLLFIVMIILLPFLHTEVLDALVYL